LPSVITPKPARHDHLKTGQVIKPRTTRFYRNSVDERKRFLMEAGQTLFIRALPGRTIWQRRDSTGAPTQEPEWRGGMIRP